MVDQTENINTQEKKRKPAGDEFIEQKRRQQELFWQLHPEYRTKPHPCHPQAESFVEAFYEKQSQIIPRFFTMISCLWRGHPKTDEVSDVDKH